MKTKVSNFTEFRAYYLSEFELYDGEAFITFNIVGIDLDRNEVQVAVTDRGRIGVVTYDLLTDKTEGSTLNTALCSSACIWMNLRRLRNETDSCQRKRTQTQLHKPAHKAGLQLCHRPLGRL